MIEFNEKEWSAKDACKQGVLEMQKRRPHRVPTSWNASRVGFCPCGLYLERKGAKPDKEFNVSTLGMFAMGNKVEERVAEEMENSPDVFLLEKQVRVEIPEFDVTGYADIVSNDRVVVEVKSSNTFTFRNLKKNGASPMHIMQTWLYLFGLDKEEGRLLYVGRDYMRKVEFVVTRSNKELEKKVRKEIEILQTAWDTGIPPLPATDWRADYCNYHKQCKALHKK